MTKLFAACDEFPLTTQTPKILRFHRFLRVVLLVAAMPRCVEKLLVLVVE
jgi:hypothetical protein